MIDAQQIDAEIARETEEAKAAEREQAFRGAGLYQKGPKPDQYNYAALYDEGQSFVEREGQGIELPNRHINKGQVLIAGRDLPSGEIYTGEWADAQGLIEYGRKGLADSVTFTDAPPPADDGLNLSVLAYGLIGEGANYDDYREAIPSQWPDDVLAAAWNTASELNDRDAVEEMAEEIPLANVKQIHPDNVFDDPEQGELNKWAAREVYPLARPGRIFDGDDDELKTFALDVTAERHSIQDLGEMYSRAMNPSPMQADQLAALYHVVNNMEFDATFDGAMRATGAVVTDLSNVLGLGLAAPASKMLARGGMKWGIDKLVEKSLLNMALAGGVSAGAEGGVWGMVDNALRQLIAQEDEFDYAGMFESGAFTALFGAALGGVLGSAISPQAAKVYQDMYRNWVEHNSPVAGSSRAQSGNRE